MERHRFDPLSFAFGLVYAVLGIIFLVPFSPGELVDWVMVSTRWVWPLTILIIGAAILVPLIRPRADQANAEDDL
ncbi:MAG: hypothetical protein FWJ92_12255 [Actinomycetes bacterium]|jgi:hypothetical protein|nr:hypothetical protein [Acidimicrobiia bacterium]